MTMDRRGGLEVRDFTEVVLGRAEFLDKPDRVLLEQVLGRGVRPRDLAALSEASTRTVQRRVRNLMRRLADPRVVFVLREHRKWDSALGSVALAVWVRGWTLRRTADSLGLSLHRVRQHAAAVRVLIEQKVGEGLERVQG